MTVIVGAIEHGIAIPIRSKGIYPWGKLEVGDSFQVSRLDEKHSKHFKTNVSNANVRYKPKRFAWERIGNGAVRVWRIK